MTGGKGHLRCILTGGTGETRDDKDKQPGPVTAAAYYFFWLNRWCPKRFFSSRSGRGYEMHIPPTGCNFELYKGDFSFSTFLVEKII